MLYLVATPIGNLEDISVRALNVLQKVDYILAEDTRHSQKLLTHYDIQKPLLSLHQHNEEERIAKILSDLKEGKELALISDAGTPLISDPGYLLVRAIREHDLQVTALPGACSAIMALTLSGFHPTPFQFVGFLPKKHGELVERLEELLEYAGTTICFESPERLTATLNALAECNNDAPVAICRELTKRFEQVVSGPCHEVLAKQKETPALGEIVLLIQGSNEPSDTLFSKEMLQSLVADVASHSSSKEAIAKVAKQLRIPKRTVYNAVHVGT